jgi:hypothetical protein
MAVQQLEEWRARSEQMQQEATEMLRIELNRMQSRWDTFVQKDEQKWKSAEVDIQQRWEAAARDTMAADERMLEIEEKLLAFDDDKDTLWRIQTAQADAIKKLPRLWLEEIENAKAQDPKRRRQPTVVPVREE